MSEELKKESPYPCCPTTKEIAGWEDKLITTLPECDVKVIEDYYSLKLAKQQEEFVKCIPEEIDDVKKYPECTWNACIADIKSKLK